MSFMVCDGCGGLAEDGPCCVRCEPEQPFRPGRAPAHRVKVATQLSGPTSLVHLAWCSCGWEAPGVLVSRDAARLAGADHVAHVAEARREAA